jgi:hypothetical protein
MDDKNKPIIDSTKNTTNSKVPLGDNSASASNVTEHPINLPTPDQNKPVPPKPLVPPMSPAIGAPTPPLNKPMEPNNPQPQPKSNPTTRPPMFNQSAPLDSSDTKSSAPKPIEPIGASTPPPDQNKDLEEKAEAMLKDLGGGNEPGYKPKSKVSKIILGVIALLVLGIGSFTAYRLVSTAGVGDIRQQATEDDDYCTFTGAWGACDGEKCGGQIYSGTCDRGYKVWKCGNKQWVPDYDNPNALCPGQCAWTPQADGQCCPDSTDRCDPGKDKYQCIDDPYIAECVRWGDGSCPGGGGVWRAFEWYTLDDIDSYYEAEARYCGGGGDSSGDSGDSSGDSGDSGGQTHSECVGQACQTVSGAGSNECSSNADCAESPQLVCTELNFTPAVPSLGDQVSFTCSAQQSQGQAINHYQFRYSLNGQGFIDLPETAAGSGVSQVVTVSDPGTYAAVCRGCVSSDNSNCTAWQSVQ